MTQKDENYWRVLNTAIGLDVRHGHQKWTMTTLSRQSKVSRPLIYYYFGKSKMGILNEAVNLFGAEFAGQTVERIERWKSGQIAETFLSSRHLIENLSALLPFYFLNRRAENELGHAIQSHEKKFAAKIKKFFPHLSDSERGFLYAVFWGLVFTPDLSDEAIRDGVQLLQRLAGTFTKP